MITIENQDVFGQVIADALRSVGANTPEGSRERTRLVNAVAKAAARIEQSGSFMEHDADENRLLIWSDSNEIYEIGPDGRCQCLAQEHDVVCWHRTAKRLIERYNEAISTAVEKSEDFDRAAVEAAPCR